MNEYSRIATALHEGLYQPPGHASYADHWWRQHSLAVRDPKGFELPITTMLHALATYADEHERRYESPVGEDGVMGEYWLDMAKAVKGLLTGETGRLDCGTVDHTIQALVVLAGFSKEEADQL